jgi:hypothetical protein
VMEFEALLTDPASMINFWKRVTIQVVAGASLSPGPRDARPAGWRQGSTVTWWVCAYMFTFDRPGTVNM